MTEASDRVDVVWTVLSRRPGRVPAALPIPAWQGECRDWMWDAQPETIRRARRSLRSEHAGAVAAVSPNLHHVLGRRLVTFDRAVTAALQPKSTRRDLTVARRAVNRLGRALDEPESRQAGWDDVVTAATDATCLDDAQTTAVQLAALLYRGGFSPEQRVGTLCAILEGGALDIAEARVALGRRRPGRWPHHQADSRLAAQGRLDLCRDLVALRATTTTCFVWLAYRRARLVDEVVCSGGVRFIRLEAAVAEYRRTGSLFGTPLRSIDELPKAEPDDDVALVQVTLEHHLPRDAVTDAVAIIDAVTGDIAAKAIGTTWRRLGWSHVRHSSGDSATSFFTPKAELAELHLSYDHERAGRRLAERADQLTRAVRRRPPYDPLIVDALRSRADAKAASSERNAVVLLGRSVEAAAGACDLGMDEMRILAKGEWPWAAVLGDLRRWTNFALGRDDPFANDPRLTRLARAIVTEVRETWSDSIDTAAVVRLGDELGDSATNLIEAQNVRELLRTLTDPEAYLRRIAELEKQADLYQERGRRVRNAVMHGNPVSQRSVSSARAWWEFIADVAVHVATSDHPGRTVTRMHRGRDRFEVKLRSGTPPVEAYS